MKVLNLRCSNGHGFEGWFASDDDFLAQNGAQRIECPLCADQVIVRMPSAPRLNLRAKESTASPTGAGVAVAAAEPMPNAMPNDMQALWLKAVRHVLSNTDDVGPRFADEARRIHYGEVAPRGIRGQATRDEREALKDEGIEVASLPIPEALKGPLQ